MKDAPVLSVKGLKVSFSTDDGTVNAVNDLSFEIEAGETLGIVGESGSGKSVTQLALMGLLPSPPATIMAEEAKFEGRDLLNMPAEELRKLRGHRMAMIFQDPMTSLNPLLTLGTQLLEVLETHTSLNLEERKVRAIDLLDRVGIPDAASRLKQYPHQLSGGMRQRVMIAMALLCDPALLIADEPTTALDVTIQAQILELMTSLQRDFGTATVLITHDLGVVAGMSHRILVMYAGQVMEEAPTQVLFDSPAHPYTIGLLRSLPRLDEEERAPLVPIQGQPPDLSNPPPGCPFAPRCPFAIAKCSEALPPMREVEPGHKVRCIRPEVAQWYKDGFAAPPETEEESS